MSPPCLPCRNQDRYFNEEQKRQYAEQQRLADELEFLAEAYRDGCMWTRNQKMVSYSSRCIFYLEPGHRSGGTLQTVRYAEKCGLDLADDLYASILFLKELRKDAAKKNSASCAPPPDMLY